MRDGRACGSVRCWVFTWTLSDGCRYSKQKIEKLDFQQNINGTQEANRREMSSLYCAVLGITDNLKEGGGGTFDRGMKVYGFERIVANKNII